MKYFQHSLTDQPTELESLDKLQVEKSEALKYLLHVYPQETTFGDKKYDYCRLKLMARRHLEHKKKVSKREIEMRTDLELRAKEERERQKRKCQKQLREKGLQPLHRKRPMFIWKSMRIQARPEHERQREGTTSFTFSYMHTAPKLEW